MYSQLNSALKAPYASYNNLPVSALPALNTAYNFPVSALSVPVSNCAQSCPPAFVPYANNLCYNHFNSCHNNYYDVCHNPCDYGFLY